MSTPQSTETETAFAKAWKVYREQHAATFDARTLRGQDRYLENRLHEAFSAGWRASVDECVSLLQVKL